MKATDNLIRIARAILRAAVVICAGTLFLYGAYVILDTLSVERNAFVSSDLLKYKPIASTKETLEYGLEELEKINEDVIGWLEIHDTHVDYPVVQGEDELEYANKDVFGNSSMTGAIYLSANNDRNFGDFYNIIYGHNMEAGAMFGDIAKYVDEDYFNSHRKGTLYTDSKSYDFDIYAVLETNAYEGGVYSGNIEKKEDASKVIDFINNNKLYGESRTLADLDKVLVFSTCGQADTDGRVVVVANARLGNGVYAEVKGSRLPGNGNGKKKTVPHKTNYWSLLNLFCVGGSLFALFPLMSTVDKYKMFGYSKKVKYQIDNNYGRMLNYVEGEDGSWNMQKTLSDAVKAFRRKLKTGTVIEALMFVAAGLTFLLTEDMTKRVVIIDAYSPLMLAIFAVALAADIICFTYRDVELPDIIEQLIAEEGQTETAHE